MMEKDENVKGREIGKQKRKKIVVEKFKKERKEENLRSRKLQERGGRRSF